jgi:hypothetical protein
VINIVRDSRWGRIMETPGEDVFLVGQFAVNFVQGFEHAPEDPFALQASACCKHFAANELESWNGSTRHDFNAIVPEQDLVDSYLPPFEDCVTQGKVSGLSESRSARLTSQLQLMHRIHISLKSKLSKAYIMRTLRDNGRLLWQGCCDRKESQAGRNNVVTAVQKLLEA